MPANNIRSPRRWNINTLFKGIILVLIVALAVRSVFRSYQKRNSHSMREELDLSIVSGDLAKTSRLLAQKINFDSKNENGRNIWDRIAFPPQAAAGMYRYEILPESKQRTPKILELLLEHGGYPNSRCSSGTPLIVATRDQPEVIKLLLARGAKADARDNNDCNALFNYVDDVETMRLLIDAGADIHAKGYSGRTPLMIAAQSGTTQTVQLLMAQGARLQDRDNDGATPLLLAAQYGVRENVEFLIKHGADIRATDRQGRTALNYAVDNRDAAIGEMLLRKGIPYHLDPKKDSLLMFRAGNSSVADKRKLALLLHCGIDIDLRQLQSEVSGEPIGNTALLTVAIMQNQSFLDQIPRHIASSPERRTQLVKAIQAVLRNHTRPIDTAKFLLENGADPNIANPQGWTPLLAATANNNVPLVKLLLAHGANVHQPMPPGITPLRIAQAYGYTEIEQLLRDKGASIVSH